MTNNDTLAISTAEDAPLTNPSGGAEMTSPVDLPAMEGEDSNGLIWTSIVIAVATGFLLLFNADALRGWAYDFEPGRSAERIVSISDDWFRQTERFYFDRPVAVMSGWWEDFKTMEFGSSDGTDANNDDPTTSSPEPENAVEPGFSPE